MLRALAVVAVLALTSTFKPVGAADRAIANDNRQAAGTLQGGLLSLELDARVAEWHPEGDTAPGAEMFAFGEDGKPAQIPGPLVRVAAGTRVRGSLRNSLPNDTILAYGLHTRPGDAKPLTIAPGETSTFDFTVDAPGTYLYWATTMRYNRATDLLAVVSTPVDSLDEVRNVAINDSLTPAPLDLKVGTSYRLRIINITVARPGLRVTIRRDAALVRWKLLAHDGAELPVNRQLDEPANRPLTIGQTIDVELKPQRPGTLRLTTIANSGPLGGTLDFRVSP